MVVVPFGLTDVAQLLSRCRCNDWSIVSSSRGESDRRYREGECMVKLSRLRASCGLAAFTLATVAAGACTAHVPAPTTAAITSTSPIIATTAELSTSTEGLAVSRTASGDICSEEHGSGALAPLSTPSATYEHTDTAELRFAGGTPPTARLCGTFGGSDKHQEGSAASTSGALGYLFSVVELGKVSTGGSYYWIGGAVDKAARSVVISFSETPAKVKATLVPLSGGWQGFAFEYSPGPSYYAPTGPGQTGPQNAGLTFTAIDISGKPVDSRYINLDTSRQRPVPVSPTR